MDRAKLVLIGVCLVLVATVGWEGYVLAIPAANISSICEPGACSSNPCSYYIYKDTSITDANTNITIAKNCYTGGNDFREPNSAALLNDVLVAIGACTVGLVPPGGIGPGCQFSIEFGIGQFYIGSNIPINFPGTHLTAPAMAWHGQGEDKTTLILDNNVNAYMFTVGGAGAAGLGDKFEVMNMKFFGNSAKESGTSGIFDFEGGASGMGEFLFSFDEFRDCLTSCIKFNNANLAWNDFDHVWFLNSAIGIDYASTRTDIRITGSKFGLGSGTMTAIKFTAGNTANVAISGCVFDTAQILFPAGTTTNVAITGNVFSNAQNRAIEFDGTGLGSLSNFKSIIASNVFSTGTGTNIAVYIGDFVDGITVTGNQFSGYTSSATVPVTLIQTHQKATTLVTQNSGMGASWTGFGIAQPAVGATTVNVQNTNPYQVRIYITGIGTGITAYKLTDPSGASNTFTTTINIGFAIDVDPYAQVALTYTGSPTWVWYGLANLT